MRKATAVGRTGGETGVRTHPGAPPAAPRARRRRADAERSIASILEAAVECFARHPEATMSDVAAAAGVGRVTLYAHFPSREALLDAVAERTIEEIMAGLDAAEVDRGPATEALARMVASAWPFLDRIVGLRAAAHGGSPGWAHDRSAPFLERVDRLLARGRADGSFRTDLPAVWLVAAYQGLVHTAGEEVAAGRLDRAIAADVLSATLLALLRPPANAGRGTS